MNAVTDATTGARLRFLTAGSAAILLLSLGSVVLRPEGSHVALWWPAAAVSVGLLLALPSSLRWRTAATAAVLVSSALANGLAGRSWAVSCLLGACNAAEALVAARLLQRRAPVPSLTTTADLGRFLIACTAGALTIGGAAGVVLGLLEDADPVLVASSVFASHGSALLLLLPLRLRASADAGEAATTERVLQVAALVALIAVTFGPGNLAGLSLAPGAALVWAALRCGSRWTVVQTALTGAAVSALTLGGHGPYAAAAGAAHEPALAITYVQLFILIISAVILAVTVAVDERLQALREVERLATHDWLTGAGNRRLLDDRLQQAQQRAARGQPCTLLVLDLDDFKAINDHEGHDQGDRVLVTIADRLRGQLRDVDTLARVGGDEFVLLLAGVRWPSPGAEKVRIRVEELVEQPVPGVVRRVGASIGGVSVRTDCTPDQLLAEADLDMYQAKADRRAARALLVPQPRSASAPQPSDSLGS